MLRLAASAAPTFAVMGNHDGGGKIRRWNNETSSRMMRNLVESAGVEILHNRNTAWNGVQLLGVGDLFTHEFDARAAFAGAKAKISSIVLCHNPDGKDRIAERHWDLMLSGHTHGGQVRFGVLPAPWAPVQDQRFLSGLYKWNGRQLFITRGVGSPRHLRLGCRPEISILDIKDS